MNADDVIFNIDLRNLILVSSYLKGWHRNIDADGFYVRVYIDIDIDIDIWEEY